MKPLRRRGSKSALGLELGGVLREARAGGRSDVNDRGGFAHTGQRSADERVGGLQQMVAAMCATGDSK